MTGSSHWPARGLYAITPDEADTARLVDRTQAILEAGVSLLQYRNKSAPAALREDQALALSDLCARFSVPLIINDDLGLALAVGASGVHLGESDGALAAARQRLGPSAIIGASCYASLERARDARDAGASYLAFGSCFASTSKPGRPRVAPAIIAEAGALGLPRVAIGGLKPDNAGMFVAAGADLIAVISGLFDAPEPGAAARQYLSLFSNRHP